MADTSQLNVKAKGMWKTTLSLLPLIFGGAVDAHQKVAHLSTVLPTAHAVSKLHRVQYQRCT
jgi:hypothetical protein